MIEWKYGRFVFEYPTQYVNALLFIAISGAHAYGWAKEDSDLDARLTWIPNLLQALSLTNRGKTKQHISNNIDVVEYSLRKLVWLVPSFRSCGALHIYTVQHVRKRRCIVR